MNEPRRELTDEELELLKKSGELHDQTPLQSMDYQLGGDRTVVEDYTTLFAALFQQGDDVTVQLFPRGGGEDKFYEGHYVPYCAKCGSYVEGVGTGRYVKCRKCGNHGLKYEPGRLEIIAGPLFPKNMEMIIKASASEAWMGSCMGPEFIPELAAWVLKFQSVGAQAVKVIETFLEKVDESLDN